MEGAPRPVAEPIRVFVGTDDSQEVAGAVLRHSIRSRTRAEVEFTDLRALASGVETSFYTGFSFYRWAIPGLCDYRGRAVYVDADIVFARDVEDLWNLPLADRSHLARPRPDGDRFFTSVMLLDCGRLRSWRFDEWAARARDDREFYDATMWCAKGAPSREGIGPLPEEWNHLDEWVPGKTKAIHYTKVRDQPWKRPGHPHERVFLDALRAALDAGAVTRDQLEASVREGHVYPRLLARVGIEPSSASATASTPVAVERVRACPSCGEERSARWCVGRDRLLRTSDQAFAYDRCGACGVVFESLRPAPGDVARFYPEDYGPFHADGAGEGTLPAPRAAPAGREASPAAPRRSRRRRGAKRVFKQALEDFYGALGPGTTFVDYGCGAGAYLDRVRAAGCATIGIDSSPVARARAAKSGHVTLPDDPASWGTIPDGSVGFVRMNHVLEHLYRPREVLQALLRKMAPGARLHVALPNPAGWSARLFRGAWHGLDCPRHAILFPPRALERFLLDQGFSEVRLVQEPLTKDHLRSWGYVLEDLGWLAPGSAESVRNVRVLRRIASVPSALAVATGRADRIHALVRK